jgi:hypothetical protein
LSQGLFDHVEEQRHFFGNYEIFLPTALIPDLKRAG